MSLRPPPYSPIGPVHPPTPYHELSALEAIIEENEKFREDEEIGTCLKLNQRRKVANFMTK